MSCMPDPEVTLKTPFKKQNSEKKLEVDRKLYIFGSFMRKKDKRKSLQPQSLSAGNSPMHSRNSHLGVNILPRTSAYQEARGGKEGECGLCRRVLEEPRLLACLHSFCTRCLQGLHQEGDDVWNDVDEGSIQLEPGGSCSGSGGGSGGSGYESEPRDHSGSEGSWPDRDKAKYGIFTRKISGRSVQHVICPTCRHETPLPLGGVSALPLNTVMMRRIHAARDDLDRASVLCDLCSSDNKAESRCEQCLVSVCRSCHDAHGRQKATARHALRPLEPAPALCSLHPGAELSVYCATCQQVVCRDCCVISHSGHALGLAARAAAERARRLRDACSRAGYVPEHVQRATRVLQCQRLEVDTQAAKVEAEVATFAEEYRRAVEAHGRALVTSAARARARYREKYDQQIGLLEAKVAQAAEAVKFAEELLSDAKEDELLSLSGPVERRLESVCDVTAGAPRCELRFSAAAAPACALRGRLLAAAADHSHTVLLTDGLQDLRVDCKQDVIMELRDSNGERIWCGGEQVAGYFRRSDSSATPEFLKVTDRNDGTYTLALCPASPGAYLLAVTLNNKPIKGSPFPCAVRVARAHTGQFHCCSFCSSGGKKSATCGCGAAMGGGYKGCGHGHAGHPGARHWSCCGSTSKRSICMRPQSQTYQFSL
ncbi:tripartite motif-containing protein 45 [Plutella xylostella]|uniref:tripartite motif-containing protein 45 n=1 Tax=Plutella xylostella TaxID=51655 RepID=UPI0020329C0B|nr:tripartite motif-containing protein 45 [Plutella xylostella]